MRDPCRPARRPRTHVVKCPQPALAVDCNQDRCSGNLRRHEIARPAELLDVRHVLRATALPSVYIDSHHDAALSTIPINTRMAVGTHSVATSSAIRSSQARLRSPTSPSDTLEQLRTAASPTIPGNVFGLRHTVDLCQDRTCQVLQNTLSCSRAKASAAVYQLGGGTLACDSRKGNFTASCG